MSTSLYLECLDHSPVISSYWIGEVGNHLSDLEQVRRNIAQRDQLVQLYQRDDIEFSDSYTRTAAVFFSQHPKCRIGIRDEYGHEHETGVPLPDTPASDRCTKCRRPRDNHKSHESLCPICLLESA